MEREAIIFYGMDLGDADRTAYMMFDGKNFKEISEDEYNSLRDKQTTRQERINIQVS